MNQCKNQNNESKIPQPSHSEDWGEVKQVNRSARPLNVMDFSEADRKRFWSKVEIKTHNECWEWNAHRNNDNYGVFKLGRSDLVATRCCVALTVGFIESGVCALHRCDNPPCCNPAHLFKGTKKQNTQDAKFKQRLWRQNQRFCARGHEMNEVNKASRGDGRFQCKACKNEAARKRLLK